MGTPLTGLEIRDTYDALIKITDNGPIGTSLKTLTDGLGNDSALALSSRGVKVNTSATLITDAASLCHFATNNFLYVRGGSAGLSIGDDAFSNSITLADNADIAFEAGSAERMRITSAGLVGIGTSSPSAKLDVVSALTSTAGLVVRGGSSIGTASASSGQILIGQTSTYRGSIAYDDNAGYLYIDNLYNNNSGNIYFRTKTAGTPVEALTILGSGNVGIGTSSPNAPIQINGVPLESSPARATIRTFDTSSPAASVGAGLMLGYQYDTAQYVDGACVQAVKENATLGNYATALSFLNRANGVSFSEKMRISSAGNVGIGTATPASKLHVYGGDSFLGLDWASANYDATPRQFRIASNGNNSGYITQAAYNSSATAATTFFRSYVNAASSGALVFESGAGNFNTDSGIPSSYTERMRITSAGLVGIGTDAPQRPLHVNGTEGVLRLTSTASGNNGFEVGIGVESQAFLWQAENSYIQIATNATERIRIDASGNVGIGTTAPSSLLELKQAILPRITLLKTGILTWYIGNPSQGSSNNFVIGTDSGANTEILTITNAANVGIGTSTPAVSLQVGQDTDVNSLTGKSIIYGAAQNVSGTPVEILTLARPFNSGVSFLGAAALCVAKDTANANSRAAKLSIKLSDNANETDFVAASFTKNGLCFNSDTAAANALDDYEEGTWTPSLIFSGGGVGITYNTQAGKYVKVGSKVSVNCYLVLSNKGSSTGNARIEGLPFTIPNANGNYCSTSIYLDGGITYTGQAQGFGNINSNFIALASVSEAGTVSSFTDANFSNSSAIMISLTYLVS